MTRLKKTLSFLVLVILVISLPFSVKLVKKITQLISLGRPRLADIVVDISRSPSIFKKPWQNLAQGGEEPQPMLGQIIPEIKALNPQYIRLDHLYDFYDVVQKNEGRLTYNWSGLDQAVDQILATGAKPFLALSYMPPAIAHDGNPISNPTNWYEWQAVIKATVEHFSGVNQRNINDVYYEVWNEPDLFGYYKTYGDKNYLDLYRFAQAGAQSAVNVNPFKIGGPATTALYKNWVETMIKTALKENWRLDFISWHQYHPDTDLIEEDFIHAREWLFAYIDDLTSKELIISEWGYDSENNPVYDQQLGAIHCLSGSIKSINKIGKLFSFEIKDGRSPDNQPFWGRWGLLTHQDFGSEKKPRYWALNWLNRLGEKRIPLSGEGSWVRGTVSKEDNGEIRLLLVNYDPQGQHSEAVPISFINLANGKYVYTQEFFLGQKTDPLTEEITTNELKKVIFMPANTALLITLKPA
ncbi:hypothetical protein KKD62_01790 [Patescibacteria group bacterium]|nr:hypothetical protein [Patescibacteria group bacterium]MBU1931082.1 hypothetical protein [Patescibacteria group bacterium]